MSMGHPWGVFELTWHAEKAPENAITKYEIKGNPAFRFSLLF
jgi:hypothetical protein